MRTFLAINLAPDQRERVWQAFAEVRGQDFPLRWVQPELIHLTVKFLGEVEDSRVGDIVAALEPAVGAMRPFDVPVQGAGAFPNLRRPKVLFAACEATPPLELLQDRVERCMASLGFPAEGRPFRPHLTLARARRNAGARDWTGLTRLVDEVRLGEVTHVTSVDVMESRLRPAGPEYEVRASIRLEG